MTAMLIIMTVTIGPRGNGRTGASSPCQRQDDATSDASRTTIAAARSSHATDRKPPSSTRHSALRRNSQESMAAVP